MNFIRVCPETNKRLTEEQHTMKKGVCVHCGDDNYDGLNPNFTHSIIRRGYWTHPTLWGFLKGERAYFTEHKELPINGDLDIKELKRMFYMLSILLTNLLSSSDADYSTGICEYLDDNVKEEYKHLRVERLFLSLAQRWPRHSGSWAFPVPCPLGGRAAKAFYEYSSLHDIYGTSHGKRVCEGYYENRKQLAEFVWAEVLRCISS